MSVRLTIWENPNPINPRDKSYRHPVYNSFISHMTSEPDYPKWNSFQRRDYLNHMLGTYNAELFQFNSMKVQIDFASQDDLTAFVLAWS